MDDQLRHYERKLAYEIDPSDLEAALKAGEHIIVIDARSPEVHAAGSIPGSVNIPHRTMDESTTHHLDRAALIVTYCDGIGCNASTKGALKMARLGFRVKELIGGLEWWRRDGFPVDGGTAGACGCG